MVGVGPEQQPGWPAPAQSRVHDATFWEGLALRTPGVMLGGHTTPFAAGCCSVPDVFMDTASPLSPARPPSLEVRRVIVSSFIMAPFPFPLYGNWAWGRRLAPELGGELGLVTATLTFAGSGVSMLSEASPRSRWPLTDRASASSGATARPNAIPSRHRDRCASAASSWLRLVSDSSGSTCPAQMATLRSVCRR